LKPKLSLILVSFKHSVGTSRKTQPVTVTKINWLMLFKGIINVYSDNLMKGVNVLCEKGAKLFIVKLGGKYNYH
jgi:hypothetical protein